EPRQPAGGPGRFKPAEEPIGLLNRRLPRGGHQEVRLSAHPTSWLRVMPAQDPGHKWTVDELEKVMMTPFVQPLSTGWRGYDSFRTHEGFAIMAAMLEPETIRAVVFAFTTGEVWSIDTYSLDAHKDNKGNPIVPVEVNSFRSALRAYGALLQR